MGAQKNRLIETVLLSTHNICFGREVSQIIVNYSSLTIGLSRTAICMSRGYGQIRGLSLILFLYAVFVDCEDYGDTMYVHGRLSLHWSHYVMQ